MKIRGLIGLLSRHDVSERSVYTARRNVESCLIVVFVISAALIFLWLHPLMRKLSMEALLFQAWSAGMLFWESTVGDQKIDLVIQEIRLTRRPPVSHSLRDRIISWIFYVFSFGLMALAFVAVALQVWVKRSPLGWRTVLVGEVEWTTFAVIFGVVLYGAHRLSIRIVAKTYEYIWNVEATTTQEREAAQRQAARRVVRSVAFALFLIATFLQIVPTWKAWELPSNSVESDFSDRQTSAGPR